jgi:hypothetical protein
MKNLSLPSQELNRWGKDFTQQGTGHNHSSALAIAVWNGTRQDLLVKIV